MLQHYTVALMDYYSGIAVVATFVFYGLYIVTVRPQLANAAGVHGIPGLPVREDRLHL